jgi:GntR family transcriptional regulator
VQVLDSPRPVSRSSQIPLHHQVANDLCDLILSGAWAPGERIPGELELIELYGASRTTIRHALADLAQDGLVTRHAGRGSFVRDPTITVGPRALTSFSEEIRARKLAPSSRILSQAVVLADLDVAERLHVPEGTPVFRLERLRYGNGEPIGLQIAHLPAELFPDLELVDLAQRSLYEVLDERYHIEIEDADETYVATTVDGEIGTHLQVPAGSAGLIVERVGWADGRPVEFTRSIMRGDRYRVNIRLHRSAAGRARRHASSRPGVSTG